MDTRDNALKEMLAEVSLEVVGADARYLPLVDGLYKGLDFLKELPGSKFTYKPAIIAPLALEFKPNTQRVVWYPKKLILPKQAITIATSIGAIQLGNFSVHATGDISEYVQDQDFLVITGTGPNAPHEEYSGLHVITGTSGKVLYEDFSDLHNCRRDFSAAEVNACLRRITKFAVANGLVTPQDGRGNKIERRLEA